MQIIKSFIELWFGSQLHKSELLPHCNMRRKLTPEECQIIRNIVEDNENSIYEQYSGRGMYGDACFGIDIDRY